MNRPRSPSGNRPQAPCPTPLGLGSVPVALVDGAGRIGDWSEGAQQLLGYEAHEVVGRSAAVLVAGGFVALVEEGAAPPGPSGLSGVGSAVACGRLMRRGRRWACALDMQHRDGGTVPVRLDAVPLGPPGPVRHWLLSASPPDPHAATASGAALRHSVLEASPVGFAVWDTQLRCVWLNSAAVEQAGASWDQDDVVPLDDAVHEFGTSEVAPVLQRVLDEGRPVIDHQFHRTPADGGRERFFSVSLFPLHAADGTALGVCTVGFDISDSRTRQRLALLSHASKRIGTTLDVLTTAQELADASVPQLADYVTVELTEHVASAAVPRVRSGTSSYGEPMFLRGGLASTEPIKSLALFLPGERVFLPPSSPIAQPLRTKRSWLVADLDRSPWLADDPPRERAARRARMHSAMVVPLLARGAALGVAMFVRADNPAPFTPDDLALAEEMVGRAALCVDNASRYTRERGTALALQRTLLPRRLDAGDVADTASRYLPTDRHEGVGGDWCDVIPLSDGKVAFVVGDVMGHGINAAAAMGQMRTAVHTLSALGMPPAELLAGLDAAAVSLSDQDLATGAHEGAVHFATCVYAVHDPVSGLCTLARAGHPPPVVVRPDGSTWTPELSAGTPLGLGLASYTSTVVPLPPGSVLALFTDGLVETRTADIDDGVRRLATALGHHRDGDLDSMCARVVDTLMDGQEHDDDVALLLARIRHRGALPTASPVPPGPRGRAAGCRG